MTESKLSIKCIYLNTVTKQKEKLKDKSCNQRINNGVILQNSFSNIVFK